MQCHGMCHLKKELIKDEERKTDESKAPVVIQLVLYCKTQAITVFTSQGFTEQLSLGNCLYLKDTRVGFTSDVFHPPTQIV